MTREVECVGRRYLNKYIPSWATETGLIGFLREHLDKPIPPSAVLGRTTTRFRKTVMGLAEPQAIRWVEFRHGERKDEANLSRRE